MGGSTVCPVQSTPPRKRHKEGKWTLWTLLTIQSVLLFLTIAALIVLLLNRENNELGYLDIQADTGDNVVQGNQPSHTMLARFRKAAVVSDHGICSEIGRRILTIGGNAVDSAIATLLCVGATNPQSSGIGGGMFMMVYHNNTCSFVNARETAPQAADPSHHHHPEYNRYGYKAVAVPGEIHGMWTAFKKFGSKRIQWKDLVMPTVRLCSNYLAGILVHEQLTRKNFLNDTHFRKMFINPKTNRLYKEGEVMYRRNLANTLEKLAESEDPVELFYHGEIAETIIKEMERQGGYIGKDDLDDYASLIQKGLVVPFGDLRMCGPPPPSAWLSTQLIVRVIKAQYPNAKKEDLNEIDFYHKLIEAEKFAYAKRTEFGDPIFAPMEMRELERTMMSKEYVEEIAKRIPKRPQPMKYYGGELFMKDDHGTSHVSVIDEQGMTVSATSTINLWLGAGVASELGILYNNQMDDFSIKGETNGFNFEASPRNLIQGGKMPVSSMSPTIIFDPQKGKTKMVVGTTGGSKIIQGVAVAIIRTLIFGETIKEAIDAPHIYHQFTPFHAQTERDFSPALIRGLRRLGHDIRNETGMPSTTHGLVVDKQWIWANSDKRSNVHMHPDGY